jgi:hypothetical protein
MRIANDPAHGCPHWRSVFSSVFKELALRALIQVCRSGPNVGADSLSPKGVVEARGKSSHSEPGQQPDQKNFRNISEMFVSSSDRRICLIKICDICDICDQRKR